MESYGFDLTVPANSLEEARRKADAGAVLISSLSAEELEKLADVVRNDPAKLALARKFLGVRS
jgi:hypothetical protein